MSEDSLRKTFQEGDKLLKKVYKLFQKKDYDKAQELALSAQKLFVLTESSLREAECFLLIAEIAIKQKSLTGWISIFRN